MALADWVRVPLVADLHNDSGGEEAQAPVPVGTDQWAVVPLGDMFNHTAGAQVVARFDQVAAAYRHITHPPTRRDFVEIVEIMCI